MTTNYQNSTKSARRPIKQQEQNSKPIPEMYRREDGTAVQPPLPYSPPYIRNVGNQQVCRPE